MTLRIEDYALIGDCETVALVGRDGSIDWLCFPRFDSPASFAALLGGPDNGRWQIAPVEDVRAVRRRYRDGTLVLETDFETDSGLATVIDFMPVRTDFPDVVRIVEGRRGRVAFQSQLTIRYDYGSIVPWVRSIPGGIRATAGPDTLYCRSSVEQRGENLHTVGDFTVGEGERVAFTLTWRPTHEPEPRGIDPEASLRETQSWWEDWTRQCTYQGEWREAVVRSLITLKSLTYAPTGGIAAAATTSLPEALGGTHNWDYRYCWVRDASFTLYALMVGGYVDEARAWRTWLVNAIAGSPDQLQIMYGLSGERRLVELELDWLAGYEGSRPVRIGNAAHQQFQLDVYGELMDAMHVARSMGLEADEDAWRIGQCIMRFLEEHWQEPDDGIWEVRGGRQHFTHSKVMAWVAVDRAVKAVEKFHLPGDTKKWRALRQQIHEEVCREGFDSKLNSFVQHYGSTDADASLLLVPLVGFLPATDPRMLGTVDYIRAQLMQDGFVKRYQDHPDPGGQPSREGAFLICTFWLADNLALQGRKAEARELFERLLALRNDVGLLSEEYDAVDRRMLGNFPQAFSHVGLINTARNLAGGGGPAEERAKK